MAKPKTLIEKLIDKLMAGGMSERKAREVSKTIAPVARAAVKAEIKSKEVKVTRLKVGLPPALEVDSEGNVDMAASEPEEAVNESQGSTLPYTGGKGAQLLQTMHGLTSTATYKVLAVKGEDGLVAARKLGDQFNVKFYPNMAFWGFSFERLIPIGASSHFVRGPYERAHFPASGVEEILKRINAEAETIAPQQRRSLMGRMKAAAFGAYQRALALVA